MIPAGHCGALGCWDRVPPQSGRPAGSGRRSRPGMPLPSPVRAAARTQTRGGVRKRRGEVMRRSFPTFIVLCVAFLGLLPGCAISDLKNTNRRLKEANDRLVSENNRLEQELAASEKEVAEKTRLIDVFQGEKEKTPAI